MKWWLLVAIACSACGRFRFDEHADDGDAAIDTPDLPDMAASCAHTFCDDFDRPPPVESGWDGVDGSGGASLTLDPTSSANTPTSFLLGLPSPSLETGFLLKRFPTTTTTAKIDLQLSYDSTTPGTAEIDLVQLRWDNPPGICTSFGYFLVRDGTGPFDLQETYGGCGGNEDTPLSELANTGFHHVVMTVTFGPAGAGGTAHVAVELDGVTVVSKPTSHEIPSSPLTLRIGGGAVRNMAAPWSIRYDDVLVDLQ